jgi:hypothetical protein
MWRSRAQACRPLLGRLRLPVFPEQLGHEMTKNQADITEFVERMKRFDPTLTPEQQVAVLDSLKMPGIATIEAALKHLQQQRHFSAKQLDALHHHLKKRWPAGMA